LDPEAEIIELADISQDDVSQTFQIAYTFSAEEFKKLSGEVESFVKELSGRYQQERAAFA